VSNGLRGSATSSSRHLPKTGHLTLQRFPNMYGVLRGRSGRGGLSGPPISAQPCRPALRRAWDAVTRPRSRCEGAMRKGNAK
jgi:hypothetical protein